MVRSSRLPDRLCSSGRGRAALAAVIALIVVHPLSGQSPTTFHAEARLVVVRATVQGSHGETVANLERSAFRVYENGRLQPITIFLRDDVPVSLGLVVDNSGSMRGRRAKVEAAALAFVRASNPLDEMFVVNFGDTPRIDVPLTREVAPLEAGIARLDSIGGTALRDAIDLAATYLEQNARSDRRALLVITDGNDNASNVPSDPLRRHIERTGIAVYAVGLPTGDAAAAKRAHRELDDLTEHTGGLACHLASLDDLESTALRLAHLIRQQYTIGYTPQNQALDSSYRKIHVVVKGPARVSVRTRAGYYATSPSAVVTRSR